MPAHLKHVVFLHLVCHICFKNLAPGKRVPMDKNGGGGDLQPACLANEGEDLLMREEICCLQHRFRKKGLQSRSATASLLIKSD